MTSEVLKELSVEGMAVPVKKWCDSSHQFLRRCVYSGNVEAHYLLGMVRLVVSYFLG